MEINDIYQHKHSSTRIKIVGKKPHPYSDDFEFSVMDVDTLKEWSIPGVVLNFSYGKLTEVTESDDIRVNDILEPIAGAYSSQIKILGINDDSGFKTAVWLRYLNSGATVSLPKSFIVERYRKVPKQAFTPDELRILSQTIAALQDIHDSALSGRRKRRHAAQDLCDDARVLHDLGVKILEE